MDEKFGPLADGIMKENEKDVLGTFDPQSIVDHWDEIRAIIAEIPSAEELAALCEKLGATSANNCRYVCARKPLLPGVFRL